MHQAPPSSSVQLDELGREFRNARKLKLDADQQATAIDRLYKLARGRYRQAMLREKPDGELHILDGLACRLSADGRGIQTERAPS